MIVRAESRLQTILRQRKQTNHAIAYAKLQLGASGRKRRNDPVMRLSSRVKETVTKDTLEMLESLADVAQDADDNHDDKKLFHIVKIIEGRSYAGWNEDV